MKIGILGGGLSGLTLQRLLNEENLVVEKEKVPGGLCRTFWKDGYGYDMGGHILFSKDESINKFVDQVLGQNIRYCRRANKIFYNDRYVKYPFENDLASLDKQDCYECLIHYLKADYPKPSNLEEWAYYTFGKGIAEKYFLPYNKKIWKTPPRDIGIEWVSRIPKPPLEDVVKSAIGIETEGYTHQLNFRYPRDGGIEALIKSIIKKESAIVTDYQIQSIRKRKGKWIVSNGILEYEFDRIVISFPIHEAIKCFENVPSNVLQAISKLRYNSIRIALIVVSNESLLDKSAVYIPDPSILPHRICFMGYFSPNLVKSGTSSLIAEVTVSPNDEIDKMSDGEFERRVIADLDRIQIINKRDVILVDSKKMVYGYVVYDYDYSSNRKIMKQYFDSIGIDLLGRFAEFEYINMDECIQRAFNLAGRINDETQDRRSSNDIR